MSEKQVEPFFARFLEGQVKVKAGVKAGKPVLGEITTSTNADQAQTMRYPSDREDVPGRGGVEY